MSFPCLFPSCYRLFERLVGTEAWRFFAEKVALRRRILASGRRRAPGSEGLAFRSNGYALLSALSLSGCADPGPGREAAPAPDFTAASDFLEQAVAARAFPGCTAAVGNHEGLLWLEAFGHLDDQGQTPTTAGTLYDLASLTKVCGTTLVVLRLVSTGQLSLEARVVQYLPAFQGGAREQVTVEQLLSHTSGLPAWKPFHLEVDSYQALLERVVATPLEAWPGTRAHYSDLGFILLGEVAAHSAGKTLEELEKELLWGPLAMRSTTRHVAPEQLDLTAPTERLVEGQPALRGIVHDENARAAGGLTGHAGLFSDARDIARLASELLRAWRDDSAVFPGKLLRQFAQRQKLGGGSHALGWDTPSEGSARKSSAGRYFGRHSFGHTGFTGTSLWIDPERDLFVLLLSNRVHPTRSGRAIHEVRARLADLVVRAVEPSAQPRKTQPRTAQPQPSRLGRLRPLEGGIQKTAPTTQPTLK